MTARLAPVPEERKVVTVLFADVVASTRLSGQLDAEDLRERMARFFGIARHQIEHHDGTVEKFIGDAVMAVFGLPAVHEDDALRAVRAALGIQAHVRPFVEAGIIPEVRIGVTTGEVVANPKAAATGEFLVTGEAVNLAARLQQTADPGRILVGEATYEATAWAVEYRLMPPRQLKGMAEPVTAYECLGMRAQPLSPRGLGGGSSPLVGRDTELAALRRCFEQLGAGSGAVTMVIGEPGIGKSRLMAEFRAGVPADQATWLVGRTLSFSKAISYWPFLEILKSAAGIVETDSQTETWAKLERRVEELLPGQVDEVVPYLGTLLGLDVKDEWRERVQYLDGEAMGRQIYRSARRFFEGLAREGPLVLVFEDLHWIDQSSSDLLAHLLPLARTLPILFCGLSRADPETPVAALRDALAREYAEQYTELVLRPLTSAHSLQLVRNLLQADDVDPAVRTLVLDRSEGNPFFAEEVIRALVDLGAIVRTRGRWQVSPDLEKIAIPDTLRGVIIARIDRLDEDIRHVLKTASVIGRSFFYRVLRHILEAEVEADRYLMELQRVDLIRERRRTPELEYTFMHALTQEAAYETILLRVRRQLHARVAEAIEALFADRLEEFFGLLAYHYARAEDWGKAQAYLFKAGDQAGRMAADAEALAHYRQASSAYGRAFGDRWDPVQRAALERKMGEAMFRRGQHQEALAYLQRALGYLGSPLPASRGGIRLATLREVVRQIGHRAAPALLLRSPAGHDGARRAEERARVYEAMGWIDYFLNVERLVLEALLLLNVSEQSRFQFGIARGSMGLGLICDLIPLFRVAGAYHRRAVAVAERIQHPLALGLAYLGLALHELHIGTWDDALAHFGRSATIYQEAGELRQWGAAASVEAWLLRLRGAFARAAAIDEELIRVGEETADPVLRGWGLTELGNTLCQAGRLSEALPLLVEAQDLFRAVPDDRWVVYAGGGIGMCYLRQGRLDEALDVLERMQQTIVARGFHGFLGAVPRGALVEAYLTTAEAARGEVRRGWLTKADRLVRVFLRQSRIDIEAAPAACRLTGTLLWLRGRRGPAQRWWNRSLAIAERLGAPYDLGLALLEVGYRTGDPAPLGRAAQIFAQIGAQLERERATRLLPSAS